MNKLVLEDEILDSLRKAREVYGENNQILVSIEELNELACVLAKYPRYEKKDEATYELHKKVLDEVADVMIILDHVKSIFGLSESEISDRITAKVSRLQRWLSHSDSMQETVDDRAVDKSLCLGCKRLDSYKTEQEYDETCRPCHMAQATEGVSPFYTLE